MANRKSRLPSLGYLAGHFDGEGCIRMVRNTKAEKRREFAVVNGEVVLRDHHSTTNHKGVN